MKYDWSTKINYGEYNIRMVWIQILWYVLLSFRNSLIIQLISYFSINMIRSIDHATFSFIKQIWIIENDDLSLSSRYINNKKKCGNISKQGKKSKNAKTRLLIKSKILWVQIWSMFTIKKEKLLEFLWRTW